MAVRGGGGRADRAGPGAWAGTASWNTRRSGRGPRPEQGRVARVRRIAREQHLGARDRIAAEAERESSRARRQAAGEVERDVRVELVGAHRRLVAAVERGLVVDREFTRPAQYQLSVHFRVGVQPVERLLRLP